MSRKIIILKVYFFIATARKKIFDTVIIEICIKKVSTKQHVLILSYRILGNEFENDEITINVIIKGPRIHDLMKN